MHLARSGQSASSFSRSTKTPTTPAPCLMRAASAMSSRRDSLRTSCPPFWQRLRMQTFVSPAVRLDEA